MFHSTIRFSATARDDAVSEPASSAGRGIQVYVCECKYQIMTVEFVIQTQTVVQSERLLCFGFTSSGSEIVLAPR